MEDKDQMIKDLNKFLQGIHMGSAAFKEFLNKAEDDNLRCEILSIIESFKIHEKTITHRIQVLGGNAKDTLGIMGTMSDLFEKVKMITVNDDNEVKEEIAKAMRMGVEQGNRFIEEHQDLEPSIKNELENILKDYRAIQNKVDSL